MSETSTKKRKLSLPLVLAGGVSSLVLALGMSPTFSAFTASITNSANTAGAGTLIMEETQLVGGLPTGTPCKSTDGGDITTNAATCATINKYGSGYLAPGSTSNTATTTVAIKNSGTMAPTSFTLVPTTNCTQSGGVTGVSATNLCSKITLVIKQDNVQKYSGTLAAFTPTTPLTLTTVGAGLSSTFTFAVTLDSTVGNTYQGLAAAQALIWTFQA
jgi:hypothetical protein